MTQPKLKIKKGDQVIVITGKDKGKRGTVSRVVPTENRIFVDGVNVVTRHVKPTQANPQGGITRSERSIHVSNVALVDPKDDKATRVRIARDKDGARQRVAARSGAVIADAAV